MDKYSGIDLHSNNCVVVVTDAEDRVLCEKRVKNNLQQIVALLEPFREDLKGVVVESTYNGYWLLDGLIHASYPVVLANTAVMSQYSGLKYSGDEQDARHLAQCMRLGIVRSGYIFPPEQRGVRDLARKRMGLVYQRTMNILSVETQVARQTGAQISSAAVKKLTASAVDEWDWNEDTKLAVKATLAVIEAQSAQIDVIEKHLHKHVVLQPEFAVLRSVPGIGEVLATTIMLETGDINRFAAPGNYASYCRCVCSGRFSNGKKKAEGNRKNGNAYLAWAFVEAAHFAMRYNTQAKRFYERKKARTSTVIAIKALAHKLARACYHMLKEQKPFDEKRCFA